MRHPGGINTQRYLAVGATVTAGLVALGFALPDNAPPPRLLNDPAHSTAVPFADPLDAMAPWRDFPVGAKVRPMVVFDATSLPAGLRSNPTLDKLVRGRWIPPDPLPPSVPRMDSWPVVPAAEALESLHSLVLSRYGTPGERTAAKDTDAPVVRITEMRLSRRTFDTDRGRISLPAWTIVFDRDIGVPATVLAVRPGDGRFYASPVPTDAEGDVTISPDGLRLTYNFLGAAPGEGNCRASYTPVFQETATAVAIGAVEHPNGHNGNGTCRLSSYRRSVSVRLTAPLGNRVAVTYTYGQPLAVRPDGTYRWYRRDVSSRN